MRILSNNMKVLFAGFNFQERRVSTKRQYVTVQKYDYKFSRNINAYGRAYGNSSGGLVTVTLRVSSGYDFRDYYERLKSNEPSMFSLVFNAVFDDHGVLSDYDSALLVNGYVVSMDEEYDRTSADEEGEQMCLTMGILIAGVSYVGINDNLDMVFTQ